MRLLLFCVSLLGVCAISLGCTCLPMTNFEKYCDADFAAIVYVRSRLLNPNGQQDFDDYYRIRLQWVYKMTSSRRINRYRLYTGSNSAMCGVTGLRPGARYVVTGKINRNRRRLTINSCSSWTEGVSRSALYNIRRYRRDERRGRCPN